MYTQISISKDKTAKLETFSLFWEICYYYIWDEKLVDKMTCRYNARRFELTAFLGFPDSNFGIHTTSGIFSGLTNEDKLTSKEVAQGPPRMVSDSP